MSGHKTETDHKTNTSPFNLTFNMITSTQWTFSIVIRKHSFCNMLMNCCFTVFRQVLVGIPKSVNLADNRLKWLHRLTCPFSFANRTFAFSLFSISESSSRVKRFPLAAQGTSGKSDFFRLPLGLASWVGWLQAIGLADVSLDNVESVSQTAENEWRND